MHEEPVQSQRPPVRRPFEVLQVLDDVFALFDDVDVGFVVVALAPLVREDFLHVDSGSRVAIQHLLDQVHAGLRVLELVDGFALVVQSVHAHQAQRVLVPRVLLIFWVVRGFVGGVHVDHIFIVHAHGLLVLEVPVFLD